jgi:siroheme synthase-like protein
MTYYPLLFNIAGRLATIIGGGRNAASKVEVLLKSSARVKVISPEVNITIAELFEKGRIEWVKRKYAKGDCDDAVLVFITTKDVAINRNVVSDLKGSGKLIYSRVNPKESDFIQPKIIEYGDLMIAISTGGKYTPIANEVKRRIAPWLEQEFHFLLKTASIIRKKMLARDSVINNELFESVFDEQFFSMARDKDIDGINEKITGIFGSEIVIKKEEIEK